MPSIALCGAGVSARLHGAAALAVGATVDAVASRDPRRAIELTGQLGGQAVLFDELPAGADLVVVCTPPGHHLDHALSALAAGTPVLVEKPMCTTLEEADRLVEESGPLLVLAENLLHAPVVDAVCRHAPTLGRITHLEVRALQGLPHWGDFTTVDWGGGALFDLGAHPVALALHLADVCGEGAPVGVTAEMSGGIGHRTDEHADVRIRFEGGLVARVVASWKAGPAPVWDLQISSETAVLRAEILPAVSFERNGDSVALSPDPVAGPLGDLGYAAQMRRALGAPTTMRPDASFGRRVLDVTCAAYASAASGGRNVATPFTGSRDRTPLQILRG